MRAITINEINFERNTDPKGSMNIGKIAEVRKLLDYMYKRSNFQCLDYELKNLNHIEIRYTDFVKKADKNESYINDVWIIKYVEIDRYIVESYISEGNWGTSHQWNIYELVFNQDEDPKRMKFKKEYVCYLDKTNKFNEERAKIMVQALNDKYGKACGFELIKKTQD